MTTNWKSFDVARPLSDGSIALYTLCAYFQNRDFEREPATKEECKMIVDLASKAVGSMIVQRAFSLAR